MDKFILKKDWNIITEFAGVKSTILIFKKGQEFQQDNSEYIIDWVGGRMILDYDQMIHAKDYENDLLFDLVTEESLNLVVSEVPDNEEDITKKWRIQLDITTTLTKMKEVEKFINENVRKLL